MRPLLPIALFFSSIACSAVTEDEIGSSDLRGGAPVALADLAAIGQIRLGGASCTGTLVTPRVVLTAKHCIINYGSTPQTPFGDAFFVVENEAGVHAYPVDPERTAWSNQSYGGWLGIGVDAGIFVLSDTVTGVEPIPIRSASLSDDEVGTTFFAVGFNLRQKVGGPQTLRHLSGKPLVSAFPNADRFFRFLEEEGWTENDADRERLTRRYNAELLPNVEAYVGGEDDDVGLCKGDSGGPLLDMKSGKPQLVGVASAVAVSLRSHCGLLGSVYVRVTDEIRGLVREVR